MTVESNNTHSQNMSETAANSKSNSHLRPGDSDQLQRRYVTDFIGNTPLLYLKEVSRLCGCDIFAKAEHMNPFGSVKDRAAKELLRAAEEEGRLRPGGTVIEGTGGNTGVSLALLA
eukprot:Nk52_evm1s2065 gene=Nk52_evmTU1s2065